jgi:hypothetical protein
MRVNSTTNKQRNETNLPFTVGFTRHGVIHLEPTLSFDIRPPIRVDFIASHDDVARMDALARSQVLLYFTDAARDDGQRGEAIFNGDVSAPISKVMVTYVNSDILCKQKRRSGVKS